MDCGWIAARCGPAIRDNGSLEKNTSERGLLGAAIKAHKLHAQKKKGRSFRTVSDKGRAEAKGKSGRIPRARARGGGERKARSVDPEGRAGKGMLGLFLGKSGLWVGVPWLAGGISCSRAASFWMDPQGRREARVAGASTNPFPGREPPSSNLPPIPKFH